MQACQAATCNVLVSCATSLATIFITLARTHNLQDEVKTFLTRGLYDINDNSFVQFLAREVCDKCLNEDFTKLPEQILQDMLERHQPEHYIRMKEMGSSVAEFLSCASERLGFPVLKPVCRRFHVYCVHVVLLASLPLNHAQLILTMLQECNTGPAKVPSLSGWTPVTGPTGYAQRDHHLDGTYDKTL